MKNIFSKTTEKRTHNGVKSYLCPTFVLSPILILAFLTLGFGQMWANKGFWDDGAWNMKYYTSGASDNWLPSAQKMGASYNLGIMTTFYLKGCWVKTWADGDWTTTKCRVYYWIYGGDAGSNYLLDYGSECCSNRTWTWENDDKGNSRINYNVINAISSTPGNHTLKLKWKLDESDSYQSSECSINFTYPGFRDLSTTTVTFDPTAVGSNNSKSITYTHYGTAPTNVAARYSITGTNADQFSITALSGTGATIRFSPTSAGTKTATLVINDVHGKTTSSITLTGSTKVTVTYSKGSASGATGSDVTDDKVYGVTLTLKDKGSFTRSGYTQTAWNTNSAGTGGTSYALKGSYTLNGAITLYPTWTANQYTITFNKQSGSGGTSNATVHYDNNDFSVSPIEVPTRTGYNFAGYYTNTGGGGVQIVNASGVWQSSKTDYLDASGNWIYANNKNVYAYWTPKSYTVTLDPQTLAEGYSASGSLVNPTVTYDAVAPAISGSVPTAANGYCFMGFYTGTLGTGYKVINSDKTWEASVSGYTSSTKQWIHAGDVTLYAFYKKAEITDITLNATAFEPVEAGDEGYVVATPTISPTPTGTTSICWEMLYENDNPVPSGHDPEIVSGSTVRFPINGLSPGSYKIRATLHTGDGDCGTGTTLDVFDQTFSIASDHTVTIVYKCGSEVIYASTTVSAKPLEWSSAIKAKNDIFGYSFSSWTAGDGITLSENGSSDLGSNTSYASTIYIKASYNGTLTANYTKRKMIFFKNTLNWGNPYVYFYKDGGYWDASKGAGCNGDACLNKNYARQMLNIAGTDIWYFDYSSTGFENQVTRYVAFTDGDKSSHVNFNGVDVVYGTSYSAGFSPGTPMFVPLSKTAQGGSDDVNGAHYYSRGYWTNYIGEGTGYTLRIYNSTGSSLLKTQKFTSADKLMSMTATVDLEAGTSYQFELLRDNDMVHGNTGSMNYSNENQDWAFTYTTGKCTIKTAASGDYTFTLSYSKGVSTTSLFIAVDYPSTVGDYRLVYKDLAGSTYWSTGSAHTSLWNHPSRVISKAAGAEDIVSFFVVKGASATLQFQHITSITSGTGAVSWTYDGSAINIDDTYNLETGVYNFYLKQSNPAGTISIEKVEPYTGEFYIRTDAANNKWDNYRASDHQMTYSSFSESAENSFGEKYSHYYMHWCPYGTNIKFVIANDYSPCISDTLIKDNTFLNNMDNNGFLLDDGGRPDLNNKFSANIRFMWNRATNRISRAYVASSTNKARKFLVLRANATIWGEDQSPVSEGFTNGVILEDKQNWMYETTLYISPGTKFKLFACYAEATPSESGAQYFRGHYASNSWVDANTVVLIGGSGAKQKARVIYDFKTNRLMAAWIPSSSAVSGEVDINADVLVEREHQEAAQYVTFANEDSKLTNVKTVYGAMKFNRWILNNRGGALDDNPDHGKTDDQLSTYHPVLDVGLQKSIYERSLYFISFPFDVKVSDIFGFGHYWDEWYLEYYDGLNRAKNGYWEDSPPNWKYVTPEMADTMVLHKYQGYILGLDLDYMAANNYNFWTNGITYIELFFPSTASQETLKQTTVTIPALSSDYECKINRGTPEGDRRVKDSYWRCLGVPSLNLYNTALTDASGTITWKTEYTWYEDKREFPFIYMWNKADNTLTPQSTSSFTFLPMHAYLVQNGGQITWTNVSAKQASIVARQQEDPSEYSWRLTLNLGEQMVDQTYIRMSTDEHITNEFDFGQDLAKELNAGRSDIYSFIGYERAAANSLQMNTETTTVVRLGLNIEATGDYTFSIPDGTNGVGVTLIDEETGIRTSLSALDYTVKLAAGDYTERFYLEISPVKGAETGMEEVTGDGLQVTGPRKVMIDGILYIVKDGKMFDATGKRVE